MNQVNEMNLVQRVAAKAVIGSEKGVLLLHPSSIDPNRNWHFPGGIRDDINEALLETVIREVGEETGINLQGVANKVLRIGEWEAEDKGEKVKILAVFFKFIVPFRPKIILSEEHDDFVWADLGKDQDLKMNREVAEILEMLKEDGA